MLPNGGETLRGKWVFAAAPYGNVHFAFAKCISHFCNRKNVDGPAENRQHEVLASFCAKRKTAGPRAAANGPAENRTPNLLHVKQTS